tara:strand:- start:98 stop:352 length:255 start_codon:yes stop_codon:yes gene_type:complete
MENPYFEVQILFENALSLSILTCRVKFFRKIDFLANHYLDYKVQLEIHWNSFFGMSNWFPNDYPLATPVRMAVTVTALIVSGII